jgi:hypothetical protein
MNNPAFGKQERQAPLICDGDSLGTSEYKTFCESSQQRNVTTTVPDHHLSGDCSESHRFGERVLRPKLHPMLKHLQLKAIRPVQDKNCVWH